VALLAGHGRVRAKQREAVLVILDLLWRDVPALHRMTLFAVRTHLPAMYVRVAVRAILSDVGEDRLYVALDALHFFVHAAQRIVRLVVIKLRHRADRTPARRRVAILAGYRQRPVRAPRGLVLLWVGDLVCPNRDCLRQIAVCAGKDQQSPDHELEDSRRNSSPTPQLGTRSKKRAEIPSIIGGLRSSGNCTNVQILANI